MTQTYLATLKNDFSRKTIGLGTREAGGALLRMQFCVIPVELDEGDLSTFYFSEVQH